MLRQKKWKMENGKLRRLKRFKRLEELKNIVLLRSAIPLRTPKKKPHDKNDFSLNTRRGQRHFLSF